MSAPELVLDASVTVAWAFEDETDSYTEAVLDRLAEVEGLVPAIWAMEVGNALIMAERRGRLSQASTVQFLALLWQLPISVAPDRPEHLLGEIMALARDQNLSTYDAAYLHLAMRRGLPLATTDAALRQAANRAGVPVYGL